MPPQKNEKESTSHIPSTNDVLKLDSKGFAEFVEVVILMDDAYKELIVSSIWKKLSAQYDDYCQNQNQQNPNILMCKLVNLLSEKESKKEPTQPIAKQPPTGSKLTSIDMSKVKESDKASNKSSSKSKNTVPNQSTKQNGLPSKYKTI
eukprot:342314_1